MEGFNRMAERYNVILLPLAMVMGMLFHRPVSGSMAAEMVPYLFMFLTMVSSMNMKKQDILAMIRNCRPAVYILLVIHVIFPCLIYVMLHAIELERSLQLGVILALIMPVGVTSVAWVTMAKGNVGTAVSMVSLSTLLAPLLVPVTLFLLAGERIEMGEASLMAGLVKLVLLPCLGGVLLGSLIPQSRSLKTGLSLSSKLSLYAIVLLNAASVAGAFGRNGSQIVLTAFIIGILVMSGYLVSWLAMCRLKMESSFEIAFTYSGGVRNFTAALVLAQLYFPAAAAIPVMVAILLQHPMALLAHTLLSLRFRNERVINT